MAALLALGASLLITGAAAWSTSAASECGPPALAATGPASLDRLSTEWPRERFGAVSVAIPDGCWAAIFDAEHFGIDRPSLVNLDEDAGTTDGDPTVAVTLIDRGTPRARSEQPTAWIEIHAPDHYLGRTEEQMLDSLRRWADEAKPRPVVSRFTHPTVPAAQMSYASQAVDHADVTREYLLGFSPATVHVEVGSPLHNPAAELAMMEAIIRTIRLADDAARPGGRVRRPPKGTYAWLETVNGQPITWKCEPIPYRVVRADAPKGAKRFVARAVQEVTDASGGRLQFTRRPPLADWDDADNRGEIAIGWARDADVDYEGDWAGLATTWQQGARIVKADVHLNIDESYTLRLDAHVVSAWPVLLHELGHAVGLDHVEKGKQSLMDPYGGGRVGFSATDDQALAYLGHHCGGAQRGSP